MPEASATVAPLVRSMLGHSSQAVVLALEPGGAIYFFGRDPPKGLGGGLRLDIPVLWGFGLAIGYQAVYVASELLPVVAHHPYLSLIYRVDDLPLVIPWGELGAGTLLLQSYDQRARPLDVLLAPHFGGGIDFKLGRFFIVGAVIRYHIYLATGQVPGAVALGLRLGVRLFE